MVDCPYNDFQLINTHINNKVMQPNITKSYVMPTYATSALPRHQPHPSVTVIRLNHSICPSQTSTSAPHKRSLSEFRHAIMSTSRTHSVTEAPQTSPFPMALSPQNMEILNSRIESLESEAKILLQITSQQEDEISKRSQMVTRLEKQRDGVVREKQSLQNNYSKLIQGMDIIAARKANVDRCDGCDETLRKLKIAESTIKFYQEEVNKWNRTTAELKVQKVDLLDEVSRLKQKMTDIDLTKTSELCTEMQFLRRQELESKGEIERLTYKCDALSKECERVLKQELERYPQTVYASKERGMYSLELQLRGCRSRVQQLQSEATLIKGQLRFTQLENLRVDTQLESEKKVTAFMQGRIRQLEQICENPEPSHGQIYDELKDLERRLRLKCQQVNVLSSQLKHHEMRHSNLANNLDLKEKQHKSMSKEKVAEVRRLQERVATEEKEKSMYRKESERAKKDLDEANKMFVYELDLIETRMGEYTGHLHQLEKQIEDLRLENTSLKELSVSQSTRQSENSLNQITSNELSLASENNVVDSQNEQSVHLFKRYRSMKRENQQLKEQIQQLVRENNRIYEDYERLNDYRSESCKLLDEMKGEAFNLFRKMERFESKIHRADSEKHQNESSQPNNGPATCQTPSSKRRNYQLRNGSPK